MTKKFPDIEPGQEVVVDWQNNDLRWACCDCNLVHVWQFRVEATRSSCKPGGITTPHLRSDGIEEYLSWRQGNETNQAPRPPG